MPIATPEIYAQMLDRAKEHGFAYPAINVSSSQTLNAALRGFADAGSDGIIQISTGGADYLSGAAVKDMVTGSAALASFAAVVAARYPVHIALHTDHCPKDKLDGFMRPLVQIRPAGLRGASSRSSSRTCGTAPPCRSPRTCRSPPGCWPSAQARTSSWRWRSAWSAARKTAWSARQPDEWTIRELAGELGVPKPTLYNWVQNGRLPSRSVNAGAGSAKLVTADAATIANLKAIRATPPPWRRLPSPVVDTKHATLDS